jgi:hypothetical protein
MGSAGTTETRRIGRFPRRRPGASGFGTRRSSLWRPFPRPLRRTFRMGPAGIASRTRRATPPSSAAARPLTSPKCGGLLGSIRACAAGSPRCPAARPRARAARTPQLRGASALAGTGPPTSPGGRFRGATGWPRGFRFHVLSVRPRAIPPGRDEGPAKRGLRQRNPGGVLLSQGASPQVPSALAGLTAVFGMGTGVSPPPWPPETVRSSVVRIYGPRARNAQPSSVPKRARASSQALGRLVPVG